MAARLTYTNVAGLNRALRALPKEAAAELRNASADIAVMVAAEARTAALRVGGVARYVAPTIRAGRDRVPVVRMGGNTRLPERDGRSRSSGRQTVGDVMWGAEFGGQRRPTTQQFDRWRGSSRGAGYFLWPSVRRNSDDIHDRYSQALLDALGDI